MSLLEIKDTYGATATISDYSLKDYLKDSLPTIRSNKVQAEKYPPYYPPPRTLDRLEQPPEKQSQQREEKQQPKLKANFGDLEVCKYIRLCFLYGA